MTDSPEPQAAPIAVDDLFRVDLRVATVLSAAPNPRARQPALVLELDLGPALGRRTSSAQLAGDYDPTQLVGTQVVCVANLPPRRVAGVDSEVLVLAAVDPASGTRLLRVDGAVADGTRVS